MEALAVIRSAPNEESREATSVAVDAVETLRDSSGIAPRAGVGDVSDEGDSSLGTVAVVAIVVQQARPATVSSRGPSAKVCLRLGDYRSCRDGSQSCSFCIRLVADSHVATEYGDTGGCLFFELSGRLNGKSDVRASSVASRPI